MIILSTSIPTLHALRDLIGTDFISIGNNYSLVSEYQKLVLNHGNDASIFFVMTGLIISLSGAIDLSSEFVRAVISHEGYIVHFVQHNYIMHVRLQIIIKKRRFTVWSIPFACHKPMTRAATYN